MNLVVGATGQVGSKIVRRLRAQDRPVRAFVRHDSAYRDLERAGATLAFGDLRDASSVAEACAGVDAVIATANTVGPRGSYSFRSVEGDGYRNLVEAARQSGVRRFLFLSVPVTPIDGKVPTARYKRRIERMIIESGISYAIVRASLFMSSWLALLGSSIPQLDEESPTLRRPFWFARWFRRATGRLIEDRGIALVPGDGETRHAWVAEDDVADLMARLVDHPDAHDRALDFGGPQVLSFNEAVEIFGRVLGRPIRRLHAPAVAFRIQQLLLRPVSEAASNLMGLNWWAASMGTEWEDAGVAEAFGVGPLTTVEEFLEAKVRSAIASGMLARAGV